MPFFPTKGFPRSRIAGLLVGFLGLVLLVDSGSSTATSNEYATLSRFACIAATFGYAIASIITRRVPNTGDCILLRSPLSCGPPSSSIGVLLEGLPRDVPIHSLWAILYAALFPTALTAYWRVLVIKSAGSNF